MPADETAPSAKLAGIDVNIGYGKRHVVENLNLIVPPRRFTALIGPNGSGKSTILRTFAGLMPATSGTLLIDGHNVAMLSTRDMARRIGVLLQGPVAPEGLTVNDLVQQGRYPHRTLFSRWSSQDQTACEEALRLTGINDLADRPLDSLSGGQRQRAWIAMTLAQKSEILLLDEPTTYLDLEHQIELMKLVTMLVERQGKTIIAVLHDINQAARYAHNIVILRAGRIIATGEPSEVISAKTVADVFKVNTMIMRDPVAGTPLCIPL